MQTKLILSFLALSLAAAVAMPARAEQASPADAAAKPLSRAEVIADLNLWRQAGVERYAELVTYELEVDAYERAWHAYQRLRSSPAFAAEVAKVLAQP